MGHSPPENIAHCEFFHFAEAREGLRECFSGNELKRKINQWRSSFSTFFRLSSELYKCEILLFSTNTSFLQIFNALSISGRIVVNRISDGQVSSDHLTARLPAVVTTMT